MQHLYVKQHNKTGLKYLGKTVVDPFKYKGSGKYWKNHINKHGYDVTTKVIGIYNTKEELKKAGIYYSKLWNIVKSDKWANLREEAGDGYTSEHSKQIQLEKVEKGIHHFQNKKAAKERSFKRDNSKFINSSKERIKEGTHHFQNGKVQSLINYKKVKKGTHPFLKENIKKYLCQFCNKMFDVGNFTQWHGDKCKWK